MYITVKQAAEKWGISDRRVRVLCSEGKITGAYQEGRAWKIPHDAAKPTDGRYKTKESLIPIIEEKLEELKKESYKDELFSVVDASKGDINNIKLLRDRYPELLLSDTKELWESIKDEVRSNYNSEVKKEIAEDFSDLREVINPEAGDIANIKTIREHYGVDLKTAKELWDSIRDDYKL